MTVWTLAAVLLTAGAAASATAGSARGLLRRRIGQPARTRWLRLARGRVRRRRLIPIGAGVAVVVIGGAELAIIAATSAVVLVVLMRLSADRRERRHATARRREVVEMCDALAAELRSGQAALRALQRVAAEHPLMTTAARSARLGGEVPAALDQIGRGPGAGGMRMVAAAWRVADHSGAGLAAVLDRVTDALRAEEATAAEVVAGLGPARATARMLAVLPAFGLLLGSGLGGDPIAFLLGSVGGHLCLAAGTLLAVAGVWWIERLAAAVERR